MFSLERGSHDNNITILCFCSFGPLPVNFTLMMCGGRQVRRLSTASSVTKPPHFILTTEWVWYWKSDQGKWIKYGQGVSKITNNYIIQYILSNNLDYKKIYFYN